MTPYYEQDGITIYHGDCREIMPSLSGFDLVVTDPPYPNNDRVQWTDVAEIAEPLSVVRGFYFWDAFYAFPLAHTAIHIWHKPNGQSAKQYERIFECNGGAQCKVFRVAAILPNYTQFKRESVNHPTQKPLQLVSRLIHPRARLILDPFMGSGTTLVAAQRMNKHAIGIEVEERYCEIAAKRLAQGALVLEMPA